MDQPQPVQPYIGRFAPSPSGPLHFGSLYTALASFLQARSKRGKWLLRIDDLDTPRNVPGAADDILTTLEHFGLHWDERILYQQQFLESYQHALNHLQQKNQLYPCTCSRKKLLQYKLNKKHTPVYPGFCRNLQLSTDQAHALRIKTTDASISFSDLLQGRITHQLSSCAGDFIIKRRDNIIAYQLAVVVDDQYQHITEVVRGYDLLDSTTKQIFLQQQLNYPTPEYMHVPIITDQQDCKLSKQSHAQAVDKQAPGEILWQILALMRQQPPAELQHCSVADILNWAILNWNPAALENIRAIRSGIG